ncbi:hypothetical protein TSAR_005138 [Trichomalopsis sarcophagae]|uniref:Uncharacterized protein n=1 Tax=Trichomalopsis sarcophagae TaxID=543379 RepID=A0A232EMZ5_9HYME|nr:hypothetical protein TSAR_005138 [Trichomalopsis sarcophagae]
MNIRSCIRFYIRSYTIRGRKSMIRSCVRS